MARTLEEMVSKGQRKLTAKVPTMKSNYDAAKSRMKSNFGNTPFNSSIKSAYNAGIDAGIYIAPDPAKWATNFKAKMG